MKRFKMISVLLALALGMSMAGCDKSDSVNVSEKTEESLQTVESALDDHLHLAQENSSDWPPVVCVCGERALELTLFCDDSYNVDFEIDHDNEILHMLMMDTECVIALSNNSPFVSDDDELAIMIDNDNLPSMLLIGDYKSIEERSESTFLGEGGMLVAWDEYLEKYPDIKALYTDEEWDQFRYEDGHIYWVNPFGRIKGEDRNPKHEDFAFWIQARVLEWDGYPEINTLDEYFDLLMRYAEANPTMPDGTEVIPYTALCDDWRFFCIESAPNYLDGYFACGGGVSVNEDDPDNPYVIDYNVTPTAELYFQKLNEVYNAGFMDEDFVTQTYEEYIEKLSSGRVLGMADQYWDFAYAIDPVFDELGLKEMGCDYVPLALTMEEGQSSQYHLYSDPYLNANYGLSVTTNCQNPDVAFRLIYELLQQDMHNLRFWGIEGVDYLIDEDGLFYRTDEMRVNWADPDYQKNHCCPYPFMPSYYGTSEDGINAMRPEEQTSEIYASVSEPLARCFEAYGASGYADMLKSDKDYRQGEWAPLYDMNPGADDDPANVAWKSMSECKREWIPKIVKSTNFESAWNQYMTAYNNCNPQDYIDHEQELLESRISK